MRYFEEQGRMQGELYLQRVTLIRTDDPIRRGPILIYFLHEVVPLFVVLFYDILQSSKVQLSKFGVGKL